MRERALIGVVAAAAAILAFQLFVPPITGLADQGDFVRTIGHFGYGPLHHRKLLYTFVEPKYVRDPGYRSPAWEQANTEYLFIGTALVLNKLVSSDGTLDIRMAGFVHALAFLAAFARLLWVTRRLPAHALIWIAALLVLTDAGYAVYWNSWYPEPASCIFFLLLLAEAVQMAATGKITAGGLLRWLLWATLWVLAKAQNAPIGLILGLFGLRLAAWAYGKRERVIAVLGCFVLLAGVAYDLMALPQIARMANSYGMVFTGILPESKTPADDLRALGLDPQGVKYSGTGAWTPGSAFPEMATSGELRRVGSFDILGFYLLRPTRFWRRLHVVLPRITLLRFSWYGNYEPSAGLKPAAQSAAFAPWSGFHAHVLPAVSKEIVFALALWPLAAAWFWFRTSQAAMRKRLEFSTLLPLCCLAALLTAIFGDAFDLVKHLYLFNLLLDACMVYLAVALLVRFQAPDRSQDSS
jgi:hypothetical protein